MKLKNFTVKRYSDRTTVSGQWRDEMRRPAHVSIDIKRGNNLNASDQTIMEGDVRDVDGILDGLAEIAWNRGWRPRGMLGAVSTHIANYKIPPEDV
jgi:hypothetical protein